MRDHTYERDFLETVARQAGLSGASEGFADAVFRRLEKGATEYGEDSFMERGRELLQEAREEAVDLPAWGLLFLQWLREQQRADSVGEDEAHHAAVLVVGAAASSLRAWHYLNQAHELLAG